MNLVPSMNGFNDFYLPIDIELHPDDLFSQNTEDLELSKFTEEEEDQPEDSPSSGFEAEESMTQALAPPPQPLNLTI